MSAPTPSPPPGWYPDPNGRNGYSYWDGSQWHPEMRRRAMPWWLITILSLLAVTVAAFVIDYVLSHPL